MISLIGLITLTGLASVQEKQTRFLNLVCQIESSGGKHLIGDDGKSLGPLQFGRPAWEDTSNHLRKTGRSLWVRPYPEGAMSLEISLRYAQVFLFEVLTSRYRRVWKRNPSFSELYAMYNLGFEKFRKIRTRSEPLPSGVQKMCSWIEMRMK